MLNHEITRECTVGIDVGDRYSYLCLLDNETGDVAEESRISTNPEAFERRFASPEPMRIAIEAGTHSHWIARTLEDCGHEVMIANARKLTLIYGEGKKNDKLDAENLARLARLDPRLLAPVKHRSESSQAHLAMIRSRDALVETRTKLVNHVRGAVKPFGTRLPKCSPEVFPEKVADLIPEILASALKPVLETITSLTERIREYDRKLKALAEQLYPETKLLQQVQGVGSLTALVFVLTLEDPDSFADSRRVGAYVGLAPGSSQSGDSDPQQRISRRGDAMLRKFLVGAAQYILGPFAQDSDLRRHGEKIAERGGKNAKKRAVVAVARKLSVLLHSLWLSGETYEPLYNARDSGAEAT